MDVFCLRLECCSLLLLRSCSNHASPIPLVYPCTCMISVLSICRRNAFLLYIPRVRAAPFITNISTLGVAREIQCSQSNLESPFR